MEINGVKIKKIIPHIEIKEGQWPFWRTATIEEVIRRVRDYPYYHDKAVDVNSAGGRNGYITKDGHYIRRNGVFVHFND